MEIRDQRIDCPVAETWIYEYIRESAGSSEDAVIPHDRLERPCARRTDADYPFAAFAGFIEQSSRLLIHDIKFGMHLMVFNIICTYRPECTKSDMQCNRSNTDALCFNFFKKRFSKMKSGSRRCRRSAVFRIYRLVSLLVIKGLFDVGRKRHLTELIKNLFQHSVIDQFNMTDAFVENIRTDRLEQSFAKHDFSPLFHAFCRLDQHFIAILDRLQHEHLYLGAGFRLHAVQSGGKDPRIVQDKRIAGFKIVGDVGEMPVFYAAVRFVQGKEPAA